MEAVDKSTGEILNFPQGKNPSPRGKGSFWISKQAIEILLENKATAMEICAYLVLAKHTDESGQFSTSGMQAIYRSVGVGHAIAERAVNRLCQMEAKISHSQKKLVMSALVYPADAWSAKYGIALPPAPIERAKTRWVINNFGAKEDSRVWIGNELVEGIGRFTKPLKRLKMCGDLAARLLLVCYRENDLEQFGGIRPSAPGTFCGIYEMTKMQADVRGYDLWHGLHKHSTGYGVASFMGMKEFSADEVKKQEELAPYWQALAALDSSGFIYQVVTVMDREPGNNEAQVIYELDTKSKHGYKPQGENGLGGLTAKLSGLLGNPVTDSQGRLYGRYAAIVPAGSQAHICGIYRLRFRVANPKNHGVKSAWARIYQGQKDAQSWIDDMASRENINLHADQTKAADDASGQTKGADAPIPF